MRFIQNERINVALEWLPGFTDAFRELAMTYPEMTKKRSTPIERSKFPKNQPK
jgi:hypothetical protein